MITFETGFLVYGLEDPTTNELRYIGKSSRGMRRPHEHLRPSVIANKPGYCAKWLRKLASRGHKAQIVVLQECQSAEEVVAVEIELIALARSFGISTY